MKWLLSNWRIIIVVMALAYMGFTTYNYIYNKAVEDTNKVWLDKEAKKISDVQKVADGLKEDAAGRQATLLKDLATIKANSKNKPVTIIQNNECIPTEDFISTYNSAILRGNK